MALPLQRTCAETQTIHGTAWVAATPPRTSVCDLRSSPVQTWGKPNKSQGLEGPFVGMTTLPTASLPSGSWYFLLFAPALGSHPEGRAGVCRGQGSPQVTIDGGAWCLGMPVPQHCVCSLAHWHTLPGPPAGAARFGNTQDAQLNVNFLSAPTRLEWGPAVQTCRKCSRRMPCLGQT